MDRAVLVVIGGVDHFAHQLVPILRVEVFVASSKDTMAGAAADDDFHTTRVG